MDTTDSTTPDQEDAAAPHDADRGPTAEEERLADESAQRVSEKSGDEYEKSIERGAAVKGEGQIVPDDPA